MCLTLGDPIDHSPPGSSIPGILQARILEWAAISFSNACMHAKSLQSCLTLCDPMDSSPPGSSVHGILQARILEWVAIAFSKNIGVGYHAFLGGISPTQGSNPGLLHCRWVFYHLSCQKNPRIPEWVVYPFSRGTSRPRN